MQARALAMRNSQVRTTVWSRTLFASSTGLTSYRSYPLLPRTITFTDNTSSQHSSFFPPAILVEPDPLCEHVLETYLHLLSKLAGGEVLPLRPGCATPGGLAKFWKYLGMEFPGVEKFIKRLR